VVEILEAKMKLLTALWFGFLALWMPEMFDGFGGKK